MQSIARRRPFRPGGLLPSPDQPPEPTPDAASRPLVYDTGAERIGEVMDRTGYGSSKLVWLRPPGGGKEWTTTPDRLQPVQAAA